MWKNVFLIQPKLWASWGGGSMTFHLCIYPHLLAQCLAHIRCSTNICWIELLVIYSTKKEYQRKTQRCVREWKMTVSCKTGMEEITRVRWGRQNTSKGQVKCEKKRQAESVLLLESHLTVNSPRWHLLFLNTAFGVFFSFLYFKNFIREQRFMKFSFTLHDPN